jgi:hypothetical protein
VSTFCECGHKRFNHDVDGCYWCDCLEFVPRKPAPFTRPFEFVGPQVELSPQTRRDRKGYSQA